MCDRWTGKHNYLQHSMELRTIFVATGTRLSARMGSAIQALRFHNAYIRKEENTDGGVQKREYTTQPEDNNENEKGVRAKTTKSTNVTASASRTTPLQLTLASYSEPRAKHKAIEDVQLPVRRDDQRAVQQREIPVHREQRRRARMFPLPYCLALLLERDQEVVRDEGWQWHRASCSVSNHDRDRRKMRASTHRCPRCRSTRRSVCHERRG